ncbi:SIS domain-containing protein [Spirillospora sp. CA-294931]|uniref:SIS domain-containing protein n=1 Tax=Spirillospora sp. CA-294931 TaxID=3240042 RepID=UPI003D94C36E
MSTRETSHGAPGWYDPAVHPELRTSPPWVMDDMIDLQPAAVAETITAVDAAADEVADLLHGTIDAGEPIVVTGTGTAGHAARGVAVALNDALGDPTNTRAEYRASEDQARAPRGGGLCIAVSHGGRSASTVGALTAARANGALTALITAADGTASHVLADTVLRLPVRDASYCHTIGYSTPIAAGLQIAARYKGRPLAAEAITGYLTGLLHLRIDALEIGRAMAHIERFVSVGCLADEPAARELALDVAEAAWIPSAVFGVEDFLHGHMVGHDEASGLAVLCTGGPRPRDAAATAERLLRAADRIGIKATLIVTEALGSRVDAPANRLTLPATDLPDTVVRLLGGALALQSLTMALVGAKGTNPDLLRRHEPGYREAVTLGGAKLPPTS